jgi:hypothetical protein
MFLSNRLVLILLISFACWAIFGCAWYTGGQAPAPASTIAEAPKSEIPFATEEPETFQADFVTSTADIASRVHYARKGTNWRVDTFAGGKSAQSIINADRHIFLDHISKTYSEAPLAGGPAELPAYIADFTQTLLAPKDHARFEKLGSEGELDRYRVTVEGTAAPWIITYDTSTKMVIRQEPEQPAPGNFVFELRQFTLDVSDVDFEIPAGYRKVTWEQFAKGR